MDKILQLEKLKKQILSDDPCPELAMQAKQLVFGSGNPDSDVVFIGEAPGKKEDISGQPFMGASGRLLNDLLDLIGLDRTAVYITNIVKYRPPSNRDPSATEKELFWPYLLQQLSIIQPRLIITLGRHAASCFRPDLVIGQEHGKLQNIPAELAQLRAHFLPLYHPAAALHNGSMRQTLKDDFLQIKDYIKQPKLLTTIQRN